MTLRAVSLRQLPQTILSVIREPGLHRDTILLAFATVLGGLGGFIFWKLVTVYYPPDKVGIASAAISSAIYLAGIANLGIPNGMVRFFPSLSQDGRAVLISWAQSVSISGALAGTVIFILGRGWWAASIFPSPLDPAAVIIFFLLSVSLASSNIFISVLQGGRQTQILPVWNIISYSLQIGCVLILPLQFGAQAIILAVAAQNFITLFLLAYWTKRLDLFPRFDFHFRSELISEVFRYSLGNQIFGLLWSLPGFVLPLLILRILGAESNAMFMLAWTIYNMVGIIPSSMSLGMLIEGSHSPERLMTQWAHAVKLNLAVLSPIVLISALLAGWFLGIFGDQYADGTILLRLLLISILPLSFNGLLLTVFRVQKKILHLNIAVIGLLLCSLGGGAIGMIVSNLDGLGWGWLAGQLFFTLCALPYFVRRQFADKE
jgi:O-antigen/teichoic acid export membrane protein